MATIGIYVTDDLRERMNTLGEGLNWSRIAQAAFEKSISEAVRQKEKIEMMNADEVAQRLRASMLEEESEDRRDGWQVGQGWARNTARFGELKRVAAIEIVDDDDPLEAVFEAMRVEDPKRKSELREALFGGMPSRDRVRGFIEGAGHVLKAVEPLL